MKEGIKKLGVLSLFSGCGGMDLGFEGGFRVFAKSINPEIHPEWLVNGVQKGMVKLPPTIFRTIFANDIMPAAEAAWVPFFAKRGAVASQFHLESIVDLVKRHEAGDNVFPEADVITGGFPCQDFSVAGKRNGFNSHKGHHGKILREVDCPTEENRGKLYVWMKRVIEIVRPKVFIAENVKGLVSLADAKEMIENDFRKIGSGYLVVVAKILNASVFGVPQNRERVIFIGFCKDSLTKEAIKELSSQRVSPLFDPYPRQTHGFYTEPLFHREELLPYVTVGDCLLDLPEPEDSQDLSHQSYSKAKWYGTHCQGQNEVNLDGIGPTVRAEHHGNIEFRRLSPMHGGKYLGELSAGLFERRLSVRECARLQTFPDSFDFVRNKSELGKNFKLSASEGYRLVGNAVPPLLAYHIAWRLQELWPQLMK